MSNKDTKGTVPGGDETPVAEYVLGVLDAAEHERVRALIAADPELQREAKFWQSQLSGLDAQFEEIKAPAGTFSKIENRLFGAPETSNPLGGFWNSLALWRAMAAGGVAIAALVVGFNLMQPVPEIPTDNRQLVATLEAADSAVKFVALYDGATGSVRLSGVAGEDVPGRDYELWIIEGDAAPVSLGLVPVDARSEVKLTNEMRRTIGEGTVFAVSLEPDGGAPDGTPTGPIVAAGAVSLV